MLKKESRYSLALFPGSRACLHGIPFSYTYIDDLLVASTTSEEHLRHLRTVFERLTEYGIVINPNKCLFDVSELDFLGHHINRNGITPF